MFSNPGFQGGRGADGEGKMADTFFVENVLEELDMDNEFYYDPDERLLYYYAASNPPQPTDDFDIPQLKTYISIVGSMADPVVGVTIRGVNFRDAELTYLGSRFFNLPSSILP